MSWLPSFLNPWFAAAAAAIAIPSLLVLYFLKLRRREMPVSSTILWRKAIQDLQVNSPFQKLRRNLLLLLQLLLLAFLCLALSRPVANVTPGASHLTVILLDRSGSMSTVEDYGGAKRSRLEEAKRKAKELVDSMKKNDTAAVIAFDDSAAVVQTFTSDQLALRNAIDSVKPSDRRSRLKLAYQLAEAQTAYHPEQLRSIGEMPGIFVFSDGRVPDVKELSVRGDVKFTRIGRDDTPNVGVVALSAKRNYERPTEVQVFARLANYGPDPVTTDVQLSIDGHVVRTVTDLKLPPDRWNDPDFPDDKKDKSFEPREAVDFPKLELTDAAVIKVEQTKPDALACDDAASVVVPPPKALSVLLVTDGNYFLEKVMDVMDLQNPKTMAPTAYEEKKPSEFDVVIFDRYTPKFMPPSGNFIWFGAIPPGLKLKEVRDASNQLAVTKETMVLDWKRDHPILRGVQLAKLYVGEALKMQLPPETETLVEGFKGPLIVLHREGRNAHLVCAFDLLQSNWPLRLSFPIFMHNALQFMALGTDMDVRESFQPGATPRVPRTNIQKVEAAQGGTPLREFKVNGPTGTTVVKVPEGTTAEVALPALDKVGVYTTEPPIPQYEKIAVNLLDSAESNTLPAKDLPGGVVIGTSGGGKSRLELWWWIVACAALPLLLIEWWVYTRRVHL